MRTNQFNFVEIILLLIYLICLCFFSFQLSHAPEDLDFSNEENIEEEEEAASSSSPNQLIEFNQGSQNRCDVMNGNWVFNRSLETQYTDASCPYLDKQVSCVLNGRPDGDYLHWQWEMDDCYLLRFDGADALEKLRGKRLMFVGDSLQREQWQSFVCLVQYHVPPKLKSMKHGRSLSVFTAEVRSRKTCLPIC